MGKEAGGIPQVESDISSPETKRLDPSQIQGVITRSHLDTVKKTNPKLKNFSLSYFSEYVKSEEGAKTVDILIKFGEKISLEDVCNCFSSGLCTNIVVAKKIPELSSYQQNEVTQAFITHFHLVVDSISRISTTNTPSKTAIMQLIKHPNFFEPNLYELLLTKIQPDGYFSKSNIVAALLRSPKNAQKNLVQNNEIFESIKKLLTVKNPTLTINYSNIRALVYQKQENAINIVSKNSNSFYSTPEDENRKKSKETINRLIQEKKELKDKNRRSEAENKKLKDKNRRLETENKRLKKVKCSLETTKKDLQIQRRKLNKRIFALEQVISSRKIPDDLIPRRQNTQQLSKEIIVKQRLTPSRPIDKISSENLNEEQQLRIEKIKNDNLNSSFAQDWVIEYYVLHYPDNSEKKLKEDEEKMTHWKQTLPNKDFIDGWILRHFFVYYPDEYEKLYLKSEKTFSNLTTKFRGSEFATPYLLKHIAVYYCEDQAKAVDRAHLLYEKLKEEFFGTELLKLKPSIINVYVIRNFDNPAEDFSKAITQFNLLLEKAVETPDDFFHSDGKFEISSEEYLQLLFEYHPTQTEDSIIKIKDAYQKLQKQFESDNFFGEFKTLALKKIAILSTDKFALNYLKLKKKIENDINNPENKLIDPKEIIKIHLTKSEERIPALIAYFRWYHKNKTQNQ